MDTLVCTVSPQGVAWVEMARPKVHNAFDEAMIGELAEDYAKRAGFSTFQPLEEITNKFSAFYLLRP